MSTTAQHVADLEWIDRKRYFWAMGLFYPLSPVLAIGLAYATGWGLLFWLPWAFIYLLVPVLDYSFGEDSLNPPDAVVESLNQDKYYRWLLYLSVPGHFISLILAAWAFASGFWGWFALVGLTLSSGVMVGGVAINTGHELGHKKGALERNLAKLVLTTTAYGHFFIEHNKGHHKDVATPEDPASARMGENIYQFAFLREIPGAAKRSWNLEVERLERKGKNALSLENEIVQTTLGTTLLFGGIVAAFGWITLPFLVFQAAYGWFHLSLANFVEHYGLKRQKDADRRYERPLPEHSWNTNHLLSNLLTYHLQRHSDHHANPTRWYQTLRHYEGVPELPSGYPGMYWAALIPPLWRKVMYPRLLEHYDHDLNKVNVHPPKREALLEKYHRPQPA